MPRVSPSTAAKKREAARLGALRKAMGLTQREFAKEFLVTHGAVGMWESGERTIPGPVLKLIAIYENRLGVKES
jgi:DNA-binding transcriptional regulator YiaG